MVEVNDCCKCIALKTGCIIIGAFTMAFCIIIIIFAFALDFRIFIGTHFPLLVNQILGPLAAVLYIIAGALLIAGTIKGNKLCILIYMILTILASVITLIFMLDGAAVDFYFLRKTTGALMIISALALIAVQIYFFIVVYSYYKQE